MSDFGYSDVARRAASRSTKHSRLPGLLGVAFTFAAGALAAHWLWG